MSDPTLEVEGLLDAAWLRWHGPLWLSGDAQESASNESSKRRSSDSETGSARPPEPIQPSPAPSKEARSELGLSGSPEPSGLSGPVDSAEERADEEERASMVQLEQPLPLPSRHLLGKALRPLARLSRFGPLVELDIEKTIEQTVNAGGLLQVVRRPPLRRLIALDLVVDQSPSMDLWDGIDTDLMSLFESLGAFRRVTLTHMREEADASLVSGGGLPEILPYDGGPRIVMVVTDTIGKAWRSGRAFRWLGDLGSSDQVILVHVFPESWQQERTALMHVAEAEARATSRYAANKDLLWVREIPGGCDATLMPPLPLFTLTARSLKELGPLTLAYGGHSVRALAMERGEANTATDGEPWAPPRGEAIINELASFFQTASPEGQELLRALAAVPLLPAVMRLVQRRFVPASRHWHLAEILFSGFIKRMPPLEGAEAFPIWYDFHEGIREEILKGSSLRVQIDVWDAVGDFLEQRYGFDRSFSALLSHPSGEFKLPGRLQKVFARVRALVYRGLGGEKGAEAEAVLQQLQAEEEGKAGDSRHWRSATGIEMLRVPAGRFQMGSPDDDEEADADEKPRHWVRLTKAFWLGKYPVTQEQYEAVMGENPSEFKKAGPRAPVERVSWDDARAFCRKLNGLSEAEGGPRKGCYFALPTEAQWEYACRAGTEAPRYGELDAIGWYDGNSGRTTHPVGEKEANGWGFHDMIGNVLEWCEDWFDGSYYNASPEEDPVCREESRFRVLRGGGWVNNGGRCRSACRLSRDPDFRNGDDGFRLVLKAGAPPELWRPEGQDAPQGQGEVEPAKQAELDLAQAGRHALLVGWDHLPHVHGDFVHPIALKDFEKVWAQARLPEEPIERLVVYYEGSSSVWEKVLNELEQVRAQRKIWIINMKEDNDPRAVPLPNEAHVMAGEPTPDETFGRLIEEALIDGWADTRSTGIITLGNLAAYVEAHVPEVARSIDLSGESADEILVDGHRGYAKIPLPKDQELEMRWIPPGPFTMGDGEDGDCPAHRVELTQGYWIGKYPVTQAQYQAVMRKNPSRFKKVGKDAPVENVSWEDAQAFCEKLSALSEKEGGAPDGMRYALPTEAQWERACRAGLNTPFSIGDGENISSELANFDGNHPYGKAKKGPYLEKTTPVGNYPPNPWGLYDMHGNVWEWCADWYAEDYYHESPKQDPKGPEKSRDRVLRGGGWFDVGGYCRSACRFDLVPDYRGDYGGFRLVLKAEPGTELAAGPDGLAGGSEAPPDQAGTDASSAGRRA